MRSRRRFCIARRLFVTLVVIAITLVQNPTLDLAHAQSFVACEFELKDRASNPLDESDWLRDGQGILHALAGDDLRAYFGFHPRIQLIERTLPNAFALAPGAIVVSSGLLDITASSAEFAFILAHELGHLVLGRGDKLHTLAALHTGSEDRLSEEFAADAYAVRLLQDRGFDPTAGVAVLKKVADSTEQAGGAPEALYPSITARISAMNRSLTPGNSY